MSRFFRTRLGLIVCAGLACGIAAGAADVVTKKPAAKQDQDTKQQDTQVLFPPDKAILIDGDVQVICKTKVAGATLKVDGESYAWEAFKPPLHVARVLLYSGCNVLRVADKRVEVFVARSADKPGGPKDWDIYRCHPISGSKTERCAACHETEASCGQIGGGRIKVGKLKSCEACFECHPSAEFEVIHSHPLEPIEHCQMCHGLHGSKEKSLLKAPAKKLCAECHDP